MFDKLAKLPRWAYDRLRWDVAYRLGQFVKGRIRRYDYARMFAILSELTGKPADELRGYYRELPPVFSEIADAIRAVPDMTPEHRDLFWLGAEKYFRFDRTALYCIVRAVKPQVFIETGTRFGISSYFIAKAMQRNGCGHLHTFDIGLASAATDYFWPESQSEIGFLIPADLRQFVTFVSGDSLTTLPAILPTLPQVDVYYFDSHQVYEHMRQEYAIVYPYMRSGGLFMSEDTGGNAAWSEFIADKQYRVEVKYCSHVGVSPEREVSAIRL